MSRVLVFWAHPRHFTAEEADAWAREELRRVAALPCVERVELTLLDQAPAPHARPRDWMLELHLRDDATAAECWRTPVIAEWLTELRLLGMRPVAAAAENTSEVRP